MKSLMENDPVLRVPVLLVDDERNIRLTVSQTLEDMGLTVHTVSNGEEALKRLRAETFGLVLLDLKLPGMDGMEVLRRIRTAQPDLPVIILTAHGSIETAVTAMKMGAADFIQKPFTMRALAKKVRDVLDGPV